MLRPLLLTLLLLTRWSCTASTPFIPVVKENGELVARPELLGDNLRADLIRVLSYYQEDWRLAGDRLLVGRLDPERRWNHTIKAMDPDWLSTHRPAMDGQWVTRTPVINKVAAAGLLTLDLKETRPQ